MLPGGDYIAVTVPFFCNDGKGDFVLHKRSRKCRDEKGCWDLGSGGLEFGETLEKAVLREVKEEYGAAGRIQEQLPAYSLIRRQGRDKTHWLVVPFMVGAGVRRAMMMEPEKATDIGVFRLGSFPRPLHTGARAALSRYKAYLEKRR